MLRLTLAQMNRSRGRLAAGGLAVAIGTAFVAVTLLAGGVLTSTTESAITASYADADLLVQGWPITDETVAEVRDTDGVEVAEPRLSTVVQVIGPEGVLWVEAAAPPADPRLQAHVLLAGALPAPGEIALPEGVAATLGVDVGDSLTATVARVAEPSEAATTDDAETLTVVGILDGTAASLYGGSMTAVAEVGDVRGWVRAEAYPGEDMSYQDLLVMVDDDSSVAAVQDAVTHAVADAGGSALVVRTPAEHAQNLVRELTGEANMLTALALAFAAVALLVAALVIGNTFQVLVAQRTRTLALLRCVGADRAQLRRSVVIEASVLGALAAIAGTVVGTTAVQATLTITGRALPYLPLPALAPVTVASVAAPLAIGVVVTVVAALGPARAATRVAPLAALRPADAPSVGNRAGRARAWLAALVTLGGAALLGLGVAASVGGEVTSGLGVAVLGGAISFVGVLLGAVFWLPRVVGLATGVLGRFGGPAARLAAANSSRNPRRVAATSTALLIGVTLVVMMATGAASARSAIAQRLDSEFPVDVEALAMDARGEPAPLSAGFARTVEELPGVAAASALSGASVTLSAPGAELDHVSAVGADAALTDALRSPGQVAGLDDGSVIVPGSVAATAGISTGATVTLTGATGGTRPGDDVAGGGGTLTLTAVVTDLPGDALVLTRETLSAVTGESALSRLWVRVTDHRAGVDVVSAIQSTAALSTGGGIQVIGPVVERASWEGIVDTMLAIVVGLLAVSVVIALVGVANTLSLSVIERRRESATLRAIGLTRGQLRATLAWEGTVIAGVGAVVGSLLGMVYGWAGAHTVLNQLGNVAFQVPWRELGLVLGVALAAGLIASVVPSRSATRTSPVEALTVE